MVVDILLSAISLLFIFEGLLPALSPEWYRKSMLKTLSADDRVLRVVGFALLLVGALIMYLVHSGII